MLRTINIKEETLQKIGVVADLSYAWQIIDTYTRALRRGHAALQIKSALSSCSFSFSLPPTHTHTHTHIHTHTHKPTISQALNPPASFHHSSQLSCKRRSKRIHPSSSSSAPHSLSSRPPSNSRSSASHRCASVVCCVLWFVNMCVCVVCFVGFLLKTKVASCLRNHHLCSYWSFAG